VVTIRIARTSTTSPGARFAASFVALLVAHELADYWAQSNYQVDNKGRHGNPHDNAVGRAACAAHVATYTATSTCAITTANTTLGLGATWRGIATGQILSATSHYFADRRYTLRALAERIGKRDFYDSGEGMASGSVALDQSWHLGWLGVAALATATIHWPPHTTPHTERSAIAALYIGTTSFLANAFSVVSPPHQPAGSEGSEKPRQQ
jgi:hypothetical protein